MNEIEDFFEYLHSLLDNANRNAEQLALISLNEYAAWRGVRDAVSLLLQSLGKVQYCLSCIENKITYFKTYYKDMKDKIDSSMSAIVGLDEIVIKSAYNVIIEIEANFEIFKENYEKTKM